MNTLYISDLDGTLLNKDALLSDDTYILLKKLIDQGIHFTCATARTAATVTHILHGLELSAPVILMNGVAILDLQTGKYVKVEYLDKNFSNALLGQMMVLDLTSFIYSIKQDTLYTYYKDLYNPAMKDFYEERVTRYNKPYTRVSDLNKIDPDTMIYSLLLDRKERLEPLYQWLVTAKDQYPIDFIFYPEIYLKDTWCLEIFSNKASKYNAVQFLRHHFSYDKVIGFGDNLNDLSLFKACDEGYAVENAKEELKQAATAIIGSNLENSVPKFIMDLENIKYN